MYPQWAGFMHQDIHSHQKKKNFYVCQLIMLQDLSLWMFNSIFSKQSWSTNDHILKMTLAQGENREGYNMLQRTETLLRCLQQPKIIRDINIGILSLRLHTERLQTGFKPRNFLLWGMVLTTAPLLYCSTPHIYEFIASSSNGHVSAFTHHKARGES